MRETSTWRPSGRSVAGREHAVRAGNLTAIGLVVSKGCQARWATWCRLFGEAICFRKYRVAPRLGTHAVRRRLLTELHILDEHAA